MTKQLNFEELEAKTSAEFVKKVKSDLDKSWATDKYVLDFEPIVHVSEDKHSIDIVIRQYCFVVTLRYWLATKDIERNMIGKSNLERVGIIVPGA